MLKMSLNNYQYKISDLSTLFVIFGLATIFFISLAPLIPSIIRAFTILFWVLFLPIFLYRLKSNLNYLIFLICILIILGHSYNGVAFYPEFAFIYLIPILFFSYVSLSEFRFNKNQAESLAAGFFIGAGFINLLTLFLFILIINGVMNLDDVYEPLNKTSAELGVLRFSLGNAIELPFLLTMSTIIGFKYTKKHGFLPVAFVILNFIVALIAQSRGVILICILHAITYARSVLVHIIFMVTIFLFYSAGMYLEQLIEIFNSLAQRFSGEDYGSVSIRRTYLNVFASNFSVRHLFIGSGAMSSFELMKNAYGDFATAESVLIQLIYEFGFIGTLFILLGFTNKIFTQIQKTPIYIWAALAQVFLFLPVTASFAIMGILISLFYILD